MQYHLNPDIRAFILEAVRTSLYRNRLVASSSTIKTTIAVCHYPNRRPNSGEAKRSLTPVLDRGSCDNTASCESCRRLAIISDNFTAAHIRSSQWLQIRKHNPLLRSVDDGLPRHELRRGVKQAGARQIWRADQRPELCGVELKPRNN